MVYESGLRKVLMSLGGVGETLRKCTLTSPMLGVGNTTFAPLFLLPRRGACMFPTLEVAAGRFPGALLGILVTDWLRRVPKGCRVSCAAGLT